MPLDGSSGLLIVDNGPAITRQSVEIYQRPTTHSEDEGLYVGGMSEVPLRALTRYKNGIKGCVADLVINTDYHLQLINHSDIGHNIGECEA
ncbi:hypothetical protein NQ314_000529 [Rhamnusium bicolor]|uniref:Laminin G domain-containing protein n=1 Tax=Rhamnusium bicolor TaxID=1586634 RepID=A0AAV8ZWU4_9CUCU|nr:hypothetical protein NQ314_000529 [Rhamnusium bicolor]